MSVTVVVQTCLKLLGTRDCRYCSHAEASNAFSKVAWLHHESGGSNTLLTTLSCTYRSLPSTYPCTCIRHSTQRDRSGNASTGSNSAHNTPLHIRLGPSTLRDASPRAYFCARAPSSAHHSLVSHNADVFSMLRRSVLARMPLNKRAQDEGNQGQEVQAGSTLAIVHL